MKKTVLSLLFALVVLLSACTVPQNANTSGNDFGCEAVPCYESLEEYDEWFLSHHNELPPNFVHWSEISMIGNFETFVPTLAFPDRYLYTLTDNDGRRFSLKVHTGSENEPPVYAKHATISVTPKMTSMRHHPSCPEVSIIIRNGVRYYYFAEGNLNSVEWEVNGNWIELYCNPIGLCQANTPFLDKLLSISETEASAAFAEIKQSLDAS